MFRYVASFSFTGLLIGSAFFALSLTPSLLPRAYIVQGALSGLVLAVGYGLGVFCVWLCRYFELPEPVGKLRLGLKIILTICVALIALWSLHRAVDWQNSIRVLMDMDPVATAHAWRVGLIAAALAMVIVAFARLIRWVWRAVATRLNRIIPRRVSNVVSVVLVGALLLSLIDGFLLKQA